MKNILKDLLASVSSPVLSKIHQYKDTHRGESCYIFGDGVSVKWFDLGAFSDKLAIPVAFIPFHKDFNKLNVEYISCQEPWWFYPWEKTTGEVKKIISNPRQAAYRQIIKTLKDKKFFVNFSNYPVLNDENIIYTFKEFHDDRLREDFITNRINAFHGSLRFVISLSIYLGFDHVYLVGCDYTHTPSRNLHWYERGRGTFHEHTSYNKDFFEIALEFIDITTITLEGASDFINAVTYKEHTGREPVFRENTELVDERYLKVLATWPGYSIF